MRTFRKIAGATLGAALALTIVAAPGASAAPTTSEPDTIYCWWNLC